MISELKDEEILEFLMNSEFEDNYSPEELKYLFFKWRYFYRLLHGKSEREKVDYEGNLKQLVEKISTHESYVTDLLKQIADKQNIIDSMKSRKLTFKERWDGKIILKDENFTI